MTEALPLVAGLICFVLLIFLCRKKQVPPLPKSRQPHLRSLCHRRRCPLGTTRLPCLLALPSRCWIIRNALLIAAETNLENPRSFSGTVRKNATPAVMVITLWGGSKMKKHTQMFNLMKLPEYVPLFQQKKAAVLGVGAVGSYLAEILAMMGVGEIWCFDFDSFEAENLAKCSGMIDPRRDIGKCKAHAVAEQTQERMIPGGKCYGIHGDLRCYGPMAFADFDILFVALDNYAAKELVNQQVLQLPSDRRPALGMAGTSGESAVAVLLDTGVLCLRCLFDESWLENADVRTSCAGPQYMQLDGVDAIVRTSGLASLLAAALLAEKFRAWVLGDPNVMNTRTTYTPYPNLEILDTAPMPKRNCPDCGTFRPPETVHWLRGSVLDLTLEETLQQCRTLLGTTDFELQVLSPLWQPHPGLFS